MASLYFLPAERSLAPSHLRSNQGWPCKKLDEMLAHHAGGAENAYFDSRLHNCFTIC